MKKIFFLFLSFFCLSAIAQNTTVIRPKPQKIVNRNRTHSKPRQNAGTHRPLNEYNPESSDSDRPKGGKMRIKYTPSGAEVWLNGKLVGTTPYESGIIPAGEYNVEIRLKGYKTLTFSRTVDNGSNMVMCGELDRDYYDFCNEGVNYYNGINGYDKDYDKAVKIFREAALSGYAYGQMWLGFCYATGNGVPLSYTEAVKWYKLAANQGEPNAEYYLGWCYETGNGISKSLSDAVYWYRKAADKDYQAANQKLKELGY